MSSTGEQLREEITAALSGAGACCGECGFEPGETGCSDCVRVRGMYADALMPLLDRLCAERDAARARAEQLQAEVRAQGEALLRQREQHATARAAGIHEASAMLRHHCPQHGEADAVFAACHCTAADVVDTLATLPAADPTTT